MEFLIRKVFGLLIIKRYDYNKVLRGNFQILKRLDGSIRIFTVGEYFANDLAFARFIQGWRHGVSMLLEHLCRHGVFTPWSCFGLLRAARHRRESCRGGGGEEITNLFAQIASGRQACASLPAHFHQQGETLPS